MRDHTEQRFFLVTGVRGTLYRFLVSAKAISFGIRISDIFILKEVIFMSTRQTVEKYYKYLEEDYDDLKNVCHQKIATMNRYTKM